MQRVACAELKGGSMKSRKLIFSHLKLGSIELTETGKDKFSGRIEFPVEIEFLRDGNGFVNGFKASNFGAKNVRFDKVRN